MLSIDDIKKILKIPMTDEDVQNIRDFLYAFTDLVMDFLESEAIQKKHIQKLIKK